MARGLRRYQCKGCGRTFNALTGTPLSGLHHKERWLSFGASLAKGETVKASAEQVPVLIGLESSLSTTPNPAMAAPARCTCCSESGAKKKATSDHYWMVTVTRRFCGSRTPSGVGTSKLDSPTPRPDKRPVAQAPFSRASRTLVTRRSESF